MNQEKALVGAFSTELHRSPDELDGVVECDVLVVAAAGEHAAAVQLPPAGVARHGQGAHAGQVLQRGRQVIRGQRVVAAGVGSLSTSYLVTTHPVMAMCGDRMPWPYLQAPVEPKVPEV